MNKKFKGELIDEKNGQLVIDLEGDDWESYNFEEGLKINIEFKKLKKWE